MPHNLFSCHSFPMEGYPHPVPRGGGITSSSPNLVGSTPSIPDGWHLPWSARWGTPYQPDGVPPPCQEGWGHLPHKEGWGVAYCEGWGYHPLSGRMRIPPVRRNGVPLHPIWEWSLARVPPPPGVDRDSQV